VDDWSGLAQQAALLAALVAAGLSAGFAGGMFGIGGGFVVVPALIAVYSLFGVDHAVIAHVAIGTSLATIIVTSLRSVQAHAARGAVDFEVLRSWAPWIVLGVVGGLFLADAVDGRMLALVFAVGVLLMGLHFVFPLLEPKKPVSDHMPRGPVRAGLATFLGGFSALLGIGGGTIAVLVMTACGKQIHRAVATSAGLGAIIAVPGAIGFAVIGWGHEGLPAGSIGYINLFGAVAIAAMSFLTAPLGVKAAHALNARLLKRVFGLYLLFTSAVMLHSSLGL
jgi:uncharacterized membrane protein YfcA